MGLIWLLTVACALAHASADRGGSSLRGALEALQRRHRGRTHGPPVLPQSDYDALYEFVPPKGYPELDYAVDIDDLDNEATPKYIVKLLDENERQPQTYEYKLIKKKNTIDSIDKQESAFRERSHPSDNERLRELFMDKNEPEAKKEPRDDAENNAEYNLHLRQIWSKYKYDKEHANSVESAPQGVVKLFKDKIVKKRYPDSWGPIAFKKKRSFGSDNLYVYDDNDGRKNEAGTLDPNYNAYDVSDEDKDDLREEYTIAFQPLDDDNLSDFADKDQYNIVEKRFPVTKRSNIFNLSNTKKKRFIQNQYKRDIAEYFQSSSGTDPKLLKDLSKIFGDPDIEIIKKPVKRNSENEEHEVKPPLVALNHNVSHAHNNTHDYDDDSHDHHMHHPGFTGKDEVEHDHENPHLYNNSSVQGDKERPLNIKKKSIDWSDYFGIDKRNMKSVSFINNLAKKQYFDTFNKEVIYPLNSSIKKQNNVKRDPSQIKPNEEAEIQIEQAHMTVQNGDKRINGNDNESKLDNIDKKLRSMEGLIVDEALHYSNIGDELDSKEEQEMKEKLLSQLAAAYSLEKMRKALKEFKQSLQIQKAKLLTKPSTIPTDETKPKRVAVKKEKVEMISNDIPQFDKVDERSNDFEEEQGAGHYLNGKVEEQFSEGYMGGSGRHKVPVISTVGAPGTCPVLAKIVQRCRGVDLLSGDRGQLFLPLCSLHQICYLCGEAPQTTCDLVFLSEADTTCEGDMSCQRAARSTLMALRELHDNLADELDGECEASPCLPATLKLNIGWQRALQR